jgi:predicted porin
MFAPGEAADGSRAGDFGSAAIGYGSGPWFAGYAFSITRGSAAATPPSTTPKQTSHLAGMTYKIGPAMLFGALNTTRNDASGPAYVHRTGWSLGMRWAVPVGQVIGQYQRSNDSTSADADFSSVALAYLYPLSRRTMLYVNAAHNTNSDNAKFAIPKTQAGAVIDPGYNPSSLAFGIRLFF